MAPLFAVALSPLARARRSALVLASVALCVWWGALLARPYLHHLRRWQAGKGFRDDPPARLVAHLEREGARGKTLFIADAHIAYWLLDAEVPTRVVHPSNLGRPAMMRAVFGPQWTAASEIDAIFAREPAFIVLPADLALLDLDGDARQHLTDRLDASYRFDTSIAQLRVYARRSDVP